MKELIKNRCEKVLEKIKCYNDKKVAIYGTGEHTKILLDCIKEYKCKVFCLVDKELKYDNKYNFNVDIIENVLDKIDAIVISSYEYQNVIYERIKKFNGEVHIIKIYNPKDYIFMEPISYKKCNEEWEKESKKVHGQMSFDSFKKYSEYINSLLNLNKYEDLLDIGCGEGSIDYFLKNKCKVLSGFDFSKNKLNKAIDKNAECKYWNQSFLDEYKYKNFNKAFSFGVIQYCKPKDLEKFILNSVEAVKNTGVVFHMDMPDKDKMHNYYWDSYKIEKKEIESIKDQIKLIFNDGSYWHDINDISKICSKNNINIKIVDSLSNYRTHIILRKGY
ncbi:class I SAM-dependent methyltransferase [Clostridium botulinum]|uniref:methyltransferase domain-containing protein n=1 Tax=Clostridium botulinum TaxID=1491 RepID=UPI000773AF29|nr:class I SAM-dependent methyltransferase [Clostridium botulinum]